MTQKIDAQETNILDYLSKNRFLIPMYQRPYTWGQDECDDLWNDIVDFFDETRTDKNGDKKYFLGSIVLYKDEQEKQNIIDGQQRTTTLNLLICALYDKAFKQKSEETQGLVQRLESCLWDIDEISNKVTYDKFRLKSEVATEYDNEKLHSILSRKYELLSDEKELEKIIKSKQNSNYERNYLFFIKKSDEFAKERPDDWRELCLAILTRCIVLPIECGGANENDRFDNALRIFNTLNNRGIPLSDADIFKGEILKNKKDENEKKAFIEEWKSIEKQGRDLKWDKYEVFLFSQYMHNIRAKEGEKTSVIGLRPFFLQKHKDILINPKTMQDIVDLSDYWSGEYDDKYSLKSQQFFDVLSVFPNDYWKYLISVCHLYYRDNNINFAEKSDELLPKIVANMLVKFINKPTIADIKPIVFNAYTSLYKKGVMEFDTDTKQILENESLFRAQFDKASNKLITTLVTLNLYLKYEDQEVIYGEIEHIHPQTTKWRTSYTGWENKDEAKRYIESIGNKIWLEKKLNIWASNKYFDDKKNEYKKSNFKEAQELAELKQNDWLKDDIIKRGNDIYQRLLEFFKKNV